MKVLQVECVILHLAQISEFDARDSGLHLEHEDSPRRCQHGIQPPAQTAQAKLQVQRPAGGRLPAR